VISTVGPYQLYGSDLVAACAAAGTDYFDLCGEPLWMRQMIEAHEATAKSTGARIVFSCGFDSLPFELGVFFCQEDREEGSRRAGQPRQRPCPRHDGNGLRRHGGEHQGVVRCRREGLTPGGAVAESFRINAGLRRSEAAARQQAAAGRGYGLVDGAVRNGNHQHPQRTSLQYADELSVRQRLRL